MPAIRRVGAGEPCEDDDWESVRDCAGGHTYAIHHHCWNRSCPKCARAWAERGGRRAAARVEGLARLWRWPPRHVWISPPKGTFDEKKTTLKQLRDTFRKVALDSGLHGGAMVIHGWRETKRGNGEWYWSPHAHFVAWGRVASRPEGWVIGVERRLESRDDIEVVVCYELDHSAYEGRGAALTWFGSCGARAVEAKYTVTHEIMRCRQHVRGGGYCGCAVTGERHDPESGETWREVLREPVWHCVCRFRDIPPRLPLHLPKTRRKWGSVVAS